MKKGHAAAPDASEHTADPADGTADETARDIAQALHDLWGDPRAERAQERVDALAHHLRVGRDALGELDDLGVQNRQNEEQDRNHNHDERSRDNAGGDGPGAAPLLQPVRRGIEKVGDRHTGDEGQQDVAP